MISWHEKDIEDYVCERLEDLFGEEYYFIGRQIDIGVGVIDVLMYDSATDEICVVEIKNQTICNNALAQIMRYIQGLYDYFYDTEYEFDVQGIKGILLGPDMKEDTRTALRMVDQSIEYHEINVEIVVRSKPIEFTRKKDSAAYNPDKFFESISESLLDIQHTLKIKKEG
jgi:RecB family endonuclease NucS